jgi:hypothetical protein
VTVEATQRTESDAMSRVARDGYWQAGYEDGTIGQTWLEHRRVLQSEAEHDKAVEVAGVEQRLEAARAEFAILNAEADRERQQFERLAAQMEHATTDRDRYPSQYSVPMGLTFIACAVLLLLADFPLSRAIAVEILHEEAGAFFSHTTAVALGIVGMGLFFKILADPFTRPRYMLPRPLRPITWVMTSCLAVFLAGALAVVLGMLGVFRADTMNEEMDAGSSPIVYGATPVPTPMAPPRTGIVDALRRAFDGLEIGFVAKVAFLALGLVLPILGGIFLSTGAARLHNWHFVKRLERRYPEQRARYEEKTRSQHNCTATISTLDRERKLALGRPTLANSRYHRYLHGYERGLCSASVSATGIGTEVQSFVRRWLSAARQRESMLRTQDVSSMNAGQPERAT